MYQIDKSLMTNVLALIITILGYSLSMYGYINGDIIYSIGIFALSGSITNWLAIHMLFEKVPLCYGSGVIPNRFNEFKDGIKELIIKEFFNVQHIQKMFNNSNNISSLAIDYDKVFNKLVDAIMSSEFGSMLTMLGGREALMPLKDPMIIKLKEIVSEMLEGKGEADLSVTIIEKAEKIIDSRLLELTPNQVKVIIQNMISKHLGWLVVWGGAFGGIIGLLAVLIK